LCTEIVANSSYMNWWNFYLFIWTRRKRNGSSQVNTHVTSLHWDCSDRIYECQQRQCWAVHQHLHCRTDGTHNLISCDAFVTALFASGFPETLHRGVFVLKEGPEGLLYSLREGEVKILCCPQWWFNAVLYVFSDSKEVTGATGRGCWRNEGWRGYSRLRNEEV
jgi:hypothetical protein